MLISRIPVTVCFHWAFRLLFVAALALSMELAAQDGLGKEESGGLSAADDAVVPAPEFRPAPIAPVYERTVSPRMEEGVNWSGLIKESLFFLGVQHSYRLATEPGTRDGLKGPFFRGYGQAITSLHG